MGDVANDVEGHAQSGGALQTAKDLFAGAAGGVAQVLIGEFGLSILRISVSMASIGADGVEQPVCSSEAGGTGDPKKLVKVSRKKPNTKNHIEHSISALVSIFFQEEKKNLNCL